MDEELVQALRKGVLELNTLACQEPAGMRREARLVQQRFSLVLISLLQEAVNEVGRLQEQLLALGVLLPEDKGKPWMQACLEPVLEWFREEYRKIRAMRRRTDGRSSTH